jgi:hypothetical protein
MMKKKPMAKPKKMNYGGTATKKMMMNMGGYGTATKKTKVTKPKATKMMGGGYAMKKKK